MNQDNGIQTPEKGSGKPSSPAPTPTAGSRKGGGTRIMKLIVGLATALRFGQGKKEEHGAQTDDVGTRLAHQRTSLAMERNYMALNRTLMAWIRTSLSMISFGFTIGKLGQVMEDVQIKGIMGVMRRTVSVEAIAYFLVILGTVALIGAAIQYRNRVRELLAMGMSRQFSIAFIIAILLAAVGAFALSSLVLAL